MKNKHYKKGNHCKGSSYVALAEPCNNMESSCFCFSNVPVVVN